MLEQSSRRWKISVAESSRSLQGSTVLVTRPPEVAGPLLSLLRQAGAETIHWPAVTYRNVAPDLTEPLRERLRAAEWLIFSSQQAVMSASRILGAEPLPPDTRIFAVGPATARVLADAGYDTIHPESGTGSEALLALPDFESVSGIRVGIVCAPGGRMVLQDALASAGAEIDVLETYVTLPGQVPAATVREVDAKLESLCITATSGHILRNLAQALNAELAGNLLERPVAVPAARLASLARKLGFSRVILAEGPRPRDLVSALLDHKSCDNAAL